MSKTLPARIADKLGRLWRRALTGDIIRRRARRPRPFGERDIGAYAVAYNRHGGYCVPLDSVQRPAARFIMGGRIWEDDTLNFMAAHAGDGDIIHAGAFFGDFLPPLSSALAPDARLWAFEPGGLNFKCAQLTLMINELTNVELRHAGLGAQAGDDRLLVADRRGLNLGGASRIVHRDDASGATEPVKIVSIDDAIPADRRVSILQLDVEGYETPALTGGLKLIRRCRPIIIVETAPDRAWLDENLFSIGYEAGEKIDDNQVFRPAS